MPKKIQSKLTNRIWVLLDNGWYYTKDNVSEYEVVFVKDDLKSFIILEN